MDKVSLQLNLKNKLGLDVESSRVVVVGMGATGLSVAKFLNSYAYKFAMVDSRDKPPHMDQLRALLPDAAVFSGGFDQAAFEVATHIVVSPGVSLSEEPIKNAVEKGVRLIGDIDLFCCAMQKPVVAISGSNGKSTVTSMLAKMLERNTDKVAVGGNLGTPALDLLASDIEIYVLELSSFQLERTSILKVVAATVLNISPDHIDRHGSLDDYCLAKSRIFGADGMMVLNADDAQVMAMQLPGREVLTFGIKSSADYYISKHQQVKCIMHKGTSLMPVSDLPLEGQHNQENALAALALGSVLKLSAKVMCDALREFKGLDHRMQRVAEIKGVTWINDSKATNVGACIAALNGYQEKVILIAGGDAKGAEMHDLVSVIKAKVKAVVLIGKDAGLIAQALHDCIPVYFQESMQQAVITAAGLATTGEHVLLSPACASIDQYQNYQQRGDQFVNAVMELPA